MSDETPTVVLVHGAFADGSSWNGVIQRLHAKGVKVTAPAVPSQYPTANGDAAVEFTVDPEKIHEVFAADLPDALTPLLAATQRPVAELAVSEPNGRPAWAELASWAVVALSDKAAGTDVVRSMAERAGATITEVEGSHVIMISQPHAVADVIMNALAAVEAPAPVG
jgi:pimeloyl-ACP methyl ester carboxylesterase